MKSIGHCQTHLAKPTNNPPPLLHPPSTFPKIALLLAGQVVASPDLIKAGVAQ